MSLRCTSQRHFFLKKCFLSQKKDTPQYSTVFLQGIASKKDWILGGIFLNDLFFYKKKLLIFRNIRIFETRKKLNYWTKITFKRLKSRQTC
ncbi:MAG: hypothetical protein RL757_473 [Bacteroidota bacterium]|jgi:hypothetical protein